MKCTRAPDPIDLEAVACGETPASDPSAIDHISGCAACRERVEFFGILGREIDLLGEPEDATSVMAGFDRLRPFSPYERRSLRLWSPPLLLAAGLLLTSAVILAIPVLSAMEQASLAAAVAGAATGELRAFVRWMLEIFQSLAPGVAAGSDVALADRSAAAGALLLLIPGGWSLVRLLAVRSRGR